MKYLSLFSGIGGFELGIIKAYEHIWSIENISKNTKRKEENKKTRVKEGQSKQLPEHTPPRLSCIGYSEIDKYAIKIYEKHFPQHKNYGDITKIKAEELPDFDLLVGGFPCQAFSIAGKRKGFDDTRGTLFFDIARILKKKRPRNFILENVKGLLSHDGGRTFKTIITTLTELGYCVEWQVLNAKNFGVPQNRERVFIVGHFGGIPERKVFPIGESSGFTNKQKSPVAGTITANYWKGVGTGRPFINQLNQPKHSTDRIYGTDGISPTLRGEKGGVAGKSQAILENSRIRRLTPLECERLMGYPDGWTEGLSDTQRYKTLGNGIVSNVVEEVVKRIYVKQTKI